MRVLVLGAGFGGLELTTRLAEGFGDETDVAEQAADKVRWASSRAERLFGHG